jgi:hypothetical protein
MVMARRTLRVAKVDRSFSLTAGEVKNWLSQAFKDTDPVILKCNNKNFRLVRIDTVGTKPVFIGRRGRNDA